MLLLGARAGAEAVFARWAHAATDRRRSRAAGRATRIFEEMALAECELAGLSELEFGELVRRHQRHLGLLLPAAGVRGLSHNATRRSSCASTIGPSPVIAERVSEQQVDLGIVSLPLPESLERFGATAWRERLDCVVLAPQEDVAVCAADSPVGQASRAPQCAISRRTRCCLLDRTTSSRALVEAAFASRKRPLTLAMEMSSVEVLKRLAELGFGVAIVPRFSVQRELHERHVGRAQAEALRRARSVGALTPRAFAPTRAASAFLELARSHTEASHSKPRRSSSSSLSE